MKEKKEREEKREKKDKMSKKEKGVEVNESVRKGGRWRQSMGTGWEML